MKYFFSIFSKKPKKKSHASTFLRRNFKLKANFAHQSGGVCVVVIWHISIFVLVVFQTKPRTPQIDKGFPSPSIQKNTSDMESNTCEIE